MSADESIRRAEELLERLEHTRRELGRLAQEEEADKALEVLTELAELAKEVETELQRARRESGAADA